MQTHCLAQSLPEVLDAVADQEEGLGNGINAGIYRERALQARSMERRLQQIEGELGDATLRLADIARTARQASA